MLQEQVVMHSNLSQTTAPICNMMIEMSEQATQGLSAKITISTGHGRGIYVDSLTSPPFAMPCLRCNARC